MSVDKVTANAAAQLRQTLDRFFLADDGGFSTKLTVGQVIKGRVLRHYEGNRYLVNFGGEDKVVDSAVPLSTNEIIRGKVIALGDKVELRRLHDAAADSAGDQKPKIELDVFGRYERMIGTQFEQYRASLNQTDAAVLLAAVKGAAKPDAMIQAGLVLAKLALPFSSELLRAVYDKLITAPGKGIFAPSATVADLTAHPQSAAELPAIEQGLAAFVQSAFDQLVRREHSAPKSDVGNDSTNASAADAQDDSDAGQQPDFGRFVLSAQTDSSVAHRVGTLLMRIGGQLREINVALFDQRNHSGAAQTKHRQIALSLDLDTLGHVEVMAKTAGDHLSIRFIQDHDAATAAMAGAIGVLRQQLATAGWSVDELSYETRQQTVDGVVTTVVNHLITQDSVSRLL